VLFFCAGLDARAAAAEGDGVTFWLSVSPESGPGTTLYSEYFERSALAAQWHCRAADLSRWQGQTVTLTLRTDGGPVADERSDWAGWGALLLTSDARAGLLRSLYALDVDAAHFFRRGTEAMRNQAYDEALRWYRRVDYYRYPTGSAVAYLTYLRLRESGDAGAANRALLDAVTADSGWASTATRFHAFYLHGVSQFEAGDLAAAQATLTRLIEESRGDSSITRLMRSDAHLVLARTYQRRRALDLALHHAYLAATLNERNTGAWLFYGQFLYESAPGNLDGVRRAFGRALLYNDNPAIRNEVLRFWQRVGQGAQLERDCAAAIERFGAEPFEAACAPT
jgi:hypothetical protein